MEPSTSRSTVGTLQIPGVMWARTLFHTRKIGHGVREHGPAYLLRAPWNELRNPRLSITRHLRSGLVSVGDLLRSSRQHSSWPDDCLLFLVDLSATPVTFDFATFLAGAELERRARGLDGMFVAFVPGPHHQLREELPEYESGIGPALRHSRLRHMLIPLLSLMPSVRGHVVCASREMTAANMPADSSVLFPEDFRVWLPRQPDKRVVHNYAAAGRQIWPLLRAPDRARELVAEFVTRVCDGRRPLVITLRDSRVSARRNSRVDDWKAFVEGVDRRQYVPIFVYDSESAIDAKPAALAGEIFCDAARWNLEVRMALYEAAWLNLAVMHGPMELCWYNERTRYLLFLEMGAEATSSELVIADGGQPIGRDLAFATPAQHIVWDADRADVIRTAFEDMSNTLESRPSC